MTTVSSREFNQDVSAAKRAATKRPVVITDRGQPSFVLMSYDEFRRLSVNEGNIVDQLLMPDDDIDFDPERLEWELTVPEL
jgi:hypothetical protein